MEDDEGHRNNHRSYSCDLCPKIFTSLQALGGHQNAHRKERRLARSLENARKLPLIRQAEMERLLLTHWAAASGYNYPPPHPVVGPIGPGFGAPIQAPPANDGFIDVDADAEAELDLNLKL